MKVQYRLSEAARKRIGIATGSIPAENQEQQLGLEAATAEERAAILSAPLTHISSDGHVEMQIVTSGYDQWHYFGLSLNDDNLTLAQVAEHARRMTAECAAARLAHYTEKIAEKTAKYREALADEKDWEPDYISTAEEEAITELGLDLAELRAAVKAYREARPIWKARNAVAQAAQAAAAAERKAQAEIKAQAERAAVIAWADEHGSDYLKRALAAGHDCSRLYWIERAAVEYPDYVLDYEKHLETRSRSCPSLAGLDERDAVLAAHPDAKAEIEWITAPGRDRKPAEDYDEFEECEGVVVDDPAYKHYLVKLL